MNGNNNIFNWEEKNRSQQSTIKKNKQLNSCKYLEENNNKKKTRQMNDIFLYLFIYLF